MVTNVTSLTGNGLKDWLIQRITAVYLAAYICFLLGYFFMHPAPDYNQWSGFFYCGFVQIITVLALFMLSLHAWIGIWTVTTDYISCTYLRMLLQGCVAIGLLAQLVWGVMIVWGR